MLRRWFVCSLVFVSFTAHANLDDCGHYLDGLKASHFNVDDLSSKDLEIDKLIMPVFDTHLATSVGRDRLRYLLHHPFLDVATILDRQAAVRRLAENSELRGRLTESLRGIEKQLGKDFDYHLNRIKDPSRFGKLWGAYVRASITLSVLAGVGGSAALGYASMQALMAAPLGLMMVGIRFADSEGYRRSDLGVLRTVIKESKVLDENLEGAETNVLARITEMTNVTRQPGAKYDLTFADEKLHKVRPRVYTPFDAAYGLSQPSTIRARDAVVGAEDAFRALVSVIGELDVLVALANFADAHRGKVVEPTILPEGSPTFLNIRAGHHPLLWSRDEAKSISNSFRLGEKGSSAKDRFLLLTGPNTGGKSTYMKMIASSVLLAQIGSSVPAAEMQLTPLALFTNKNASEQLDNGESSFSAQCNRVADILGRAKSYRHVLILADEILTGTSPEEHTAIEQAIIEHMVTSPYIGLLATHDRKLQKLEGEMDGVLNIHVDDKAKNTYSVIEGPSRKRNAIDVLRGAGVEDSIVRSAQRYLDLNFPEL